MCKEHCRLYLRYATVMNTQSYQPILFVQKRPRITGTSGQPVQDIYKYSGIDNCLEILDNCLSWGHIAPTAPDTLGCYPFYKEDPFILKECPHILFAGNQPQFDHKIHKGPSGQKTLILTVPRFCKTGTVAVVNLRTLDTYPMTFTSELGEECIEMDSPGVDK